MMISKERVPQLHAAEPGSDSRQTFGGCRWAFS
jgi:hypothetical protein